MKQDKPKIFGYLLTAVATLLLLGVIFEVEFLNKNVTLFAALFVMWLGTIATIAPCMGCHRQ